MDKSSGEIVVRKLTRRQTQCVELVIKQLTSKEIARELGITPSTVDSHIASVMNQFSFSNRSQMARFFLEQNNSKNFLLHSNLSNFDQQKSQKMKIFQIKFARIRKKYNYFSENITLFILINIFIIYIAAQILSNNLIFISPNPK